MCCIRYVSYRKTISWVYVNQVPVRQGTAAGVCGRSRLVFNIFRRSYKTISLRSKKNSSHTTRQTKYMAGNVKKFGFLKNPLSELGWDMLEKCMFLKWKFFQMLLKNFLRIVWPCSIYLEGCLRPYRSKDIGKKPLHFGKKTGCIRLPFRPL